MLNLSELEQFVTFCRAGFPVRRRADASYIQPTLTRTMKHVEAAFGVPLFRRSKNKIELNETGLQAVQQAKNLLSAAAGAMQQVHSYHARLHTIAVESCAPAPLWSLLPVLSASFPERTVSSRLSPPASIAGRVLSGRCEIGILPLPGRGSRSCLSACCSGAFVRVRTANHPLAERGSLTFAELNGLTCLLRSEIGFWIELCRRCMPVSKFLIQTDEFAFRELVRESALPCFRPTFPLPEPMRCRAELPSPLRMHRPMWSITLSAEKLMPPIGPLQINGVQSCPPHRRRNRKRRSQLSNTGQRQFPAASFLPWREYGMILNNRKPLKPLCLYTFPRVFPLSLFRQSLPQSQQELHYEKKPHCRMDADRCGIRPGSHGPSRPQYLSQHQKEKITVPDPGVSDSSVSIRVKIGDTVQKMNLDSYVQGVLRPRCPLPLN